MNENQSKQNSTWRELNAIQFSLMSFKELLVGKAVIYRSDNQFAVRIIEIGSPKRQFHKLALEIYSFCHENSINLSPEWVPRSSNIEADIIKQAY